MSLLSKGYNKVTRIIGNIAPPQSETKFFENGTLTPEEFVRAGDHLTANFPLWEWQSVTSADLRVDYLPPEKQFIINRGIKSLARAKLTSHRPVFTKAAEDSDFVLCEEPETSRIKNSAEEVIEINSDEENDDDEEEEEEEEEEDIAVAVPKKPSPSSSATASVPLDDWNVRTYDIFIAYDNFHHTPRLWLFGYDSNSAPLTPEQIMEDINDTYANKVVTVDRHPFMNLQCANIHPCRHASMMKRLIDNYEKDSQHIQVDQYLIFFLKFMAVVLPTIPYDHTGIRL